MKAIGGAFYYNRETKSGEITAPIKREKESIIKRVCAADGDYSKTEFKVSGISEDKKMSCLEVYPKTGRTHQIRVHTAHSGHPVIGDAVYGSENINRNFAFLNGQCLHSKSIEFIHPITGDNIFIESNLPEYFIKVLNLLK